jgi:hypothetical protein
VRGKDRQQAAMFSYVSAEARIPQDHPLRAIRRTVDEVLRSMSKDFDAVYAKGGRHSILPERLFHALLLHTSQEVYFYSVDGSRLATYNVQVVGSNPNLSDTATALSIILARSRLPMLLTTWVPGAGRKLFFRPRMRRHIIRTATTRARQPLTIK